MIKTIFLTNNQVLVSQIEEVGADIGEPDCKLINPFIVADDKTMQPWLLHVTRDDEFMISSDKIITLAEPPPTLLEKYLDLIKE